MIASTVEVICEVPRVRAIRVGNGATIGATALAGDTIYERAFYPQFVRDLRTANLRVLMLGNSGVGTSTFQFYLLARYMNPKQFQDIGSEPPEDPIMFGSAAPPKVVIRHLPGEFHVMFLETCVVHRVLSREVLWCFDPATTLYFFEPGVTKDVEPTRGSLVLPTLATMSPNIKRYKEFSKDATTMYCPVYKKKELLAIGRDMRKAARGFPSKLDDLYSDANIKERFKNFNGIFRYVLPKTAKEERANLLARNGYLTADKEAADLIDLDPLTMIQRAAVTFALMYDIGHLDNGDWDFFIYSFMYAGPHVIDIVRKAYRKKTLAELLRTLQSTDQSSLFTKKAPELFENVVARRLTEGDGVRWRRRRVEESPVPVSGRLKVILKLVESAPPMYTEMEGKTLYRPLNPSFPFCDMMYKDEKGALVCIQVSWTPDRVVKAGPFQKFCHAVGLCADKEEFTAEEARWVKGHVLLVFCPRPSLYEEATLSFKQGCVLEGGDIVRMDYGSRR